MSLLNGNGHNPPTEDQAAEFAYQNYPAILNQFSAIITLLAAPPKPCSTPSPPKPAHTRWTPSPSTPRSPPAWTRSPTSPSGRSPSLPAPPTSPASPDPCSSYPAETKATSPYPGGCTSPPSRTCRRPGTCSPGWHPWRSTQHAGGEAVDPHR